MSQLTQFSSVNIEQKIIKSPFDEITIHSYAHQVAVSKNFKGLINFNLGSHRRRLCVGAREREAMQIY